MQWKIQDKWAWHRHFKWWPVRVDDTVYCLCVMERCRVSPASGKGWLYRSLAEAAMMNYQDSLQPCAS